MNKPDMICDLEAKVIQWAKEKGIADPDNAHNQLDKFKEEALEMEAEMFGGTEEDFENELGDVLVTLAILAHQNKTSFAMALQSAYDKISKRKGKTIGGVFVKESDLLATEEI